MSKKTRPLLYIYQPNEVEVEAINQEFVYKKFKLHVNVKPSVEKGANTLDPNFEEEITDGESVREKLKYVFNQSNKDQHMEIIVGNQTYEGSIENLDSKTVVVLTKEEPVLINVSEITSVKVN